MSDAIALRGITKRFPGLVALDDVTLTVAKGTCHAVCGENGAGKSTLGKILAGIHIPDAGEMFLDGAPVRFASPRDALSSGVAMVHQELAFCDQMSVAENLCLGSLPQAMGFVDRAELRRRADALLAAVDAPVDPDRPMHSLSVAEQQLVQIAAAVGAGARVIVFDEATSSLGQSETETLYAVIDSLKARGVTVIYVSHRMAELFHIADMMTVLRDGRHVGTWPKSELDEPALIQHMIGRSMGQYFATHEGTARGEERLCVKGLTAPGRFADVSFAVHAGEVVGLAGLVGAGRTEIANALFGLDPDAHGQIWVRGKSVRLNSPRDAMRVGMGYVPEDRKRHGLVLSMRAGPNVTLPTIERFATMGFVDGAAEEVESRGYFERLSIKANPVDSTVNLSGGTQQKLVLSKWLAAASDILILDEPTRGVDVGTKAELHGWIDRLAGEGTAVLLISSELPELLHVATRILVLRAGRIVGELSRREATQENLLRMMAGV